MSSITKAVKSLLNLLNLLSETIFVHCQKNLFSEIRLKSKTFGDRAFEKMAPKLWNNLPKNIRSITDFDEFKSMLKSHLLIIISYLILKFHNLSLMFTFHMHRDYFYGIMRF